MKANPDALLSAFQKGILFFLTIVSVGILIAAASIPSLPRTGQHFKDDDRSGLPEVFQNFSEEISIYKDGDYAVIQTKSVPNHPSPYFDEKDERFATNETKGFVRNPHRIREMEMEFRIPLNPTEAKNKRATNLGPIGVSVNGVVFFNQYAARGMNLAYEAKTFDQYNGHPQDHGTYHYHIEPLYLNQTLGRSAFMGFLLDGFPVYGAEENGRILRSDELDAYHGHFGPTKEYPDGVYHYHFTEDFPYLNGDGYFGQAGTGSH